MLSDFLKYKRNTFIVYFIFLFILLGTFLLYRLPVTAVIYPIALCGFIGLIFLAVEFVKFRKKHITLETVKQMTDILTDALPKSDLFPEKDYLEIIGLLKKEEIKLEEDFSEKYRDITEYYSVWAHQIKTPIASMKLTLQNEDSPQSRKLLSELRRIEQYVEMVLAYIRLESSSTDYVFKEYDVDQIIKQSLKRFAPDFIGKKIRLEYENIDEKIVTDEKWFSLVIEQILSNALKYTKEGSVKIYKTEDRRLCIEDTGMGIASSDLPRIFEKGYTGFNGRTDKSSSGIGLYLCRRVSENLRMKIFADSTEGQGTKIYLEMLRNTD